MANGGRVIGGAGDNRRRNASPFVMQLGYVAATISSAAAWRIGIFNGGGGGSGGVGSFGGRGIAMAYSMAAIGLFVKAYGWR